MLFDSLGLSPEILQAIKEEGYQTPSPIQLKAIPIILNGKDMMAAAQTGTGKTAAFTLPLLERLKKYANHSTSPAKHPIRALILTPTRELADQVYESVVRYSRYLPLRALAVFGGVDINGQIKPLREGVEILVATPGRLLDHIQQKTVFLNQVEFLVLDEADRMLDMGFIHDIRRIMTLLTAPKQTLLFSATFSNSIQELAQTFMQSPERIEVAGQNTTSESITQYVHLVEKYKKLSVLKHLIQYHEMRQVIVFCRTKQSTDSVTRELMRAGIVAEAIHGDRTQQARLATLNAFKENQVQVLVATDVAARGLDIEALPFVINFELSSNAEDYVHRIGRTGRAGSQGVAITLISAGEEKFLEEIRQLTKQALPLTPIQGYVSVQPLPVNVKKETSNESFTKVKEGPVLLGKIASSENASPATARSNKAVPALLLPPKK